MKIKQIIGIDVSKLIIDVCIDSNAKQQVFENSTAGFKKMLVWVGQHSQCCSSSTLFIFEHTGLYSHSLAVFLAAQTLSFKQVSGLAIKRSLGLVRGKADRVDAKQIALYGYRLRQELVPDKLPSEQLLSLKDLLCLRERLVKQRAAHQGCLKQQKRVLDKSKNPLLFQVQEQTISHLSQQIEQLEQEMMELIKTHQELDKSYKLLTSLKGIGRQTALFLVVYTQGFTKFKNAREFACYCGIAPFENSSGTSIRGRTKLSHLANKKLKSLLDLCAKVAIQHNLEMKSYYHRRVKEGKNKMSTINIIRNKLLARAFAVVQRGTPYVELINYAA